MADPDSHVEADEARGAPAGLQGVGGPLAGTDARPDDPLDARDGALPDPDDQGGENAFQDELRAHAAAQGEAGEHRRGLDDTRASAGLGSMNDNDSL